VDGEAGEGERQAEAWHVSRGGARAEGDVAPTLTGQGGGSGRRPGRSSTEQTVVDARPLVGDEHATHSLTRGCHGPGGEDGTGRGVPIVAAQLYGNDHSAMEDASPPLRADPHGDANVPLVAGPDVAAPLSASAGGRGGGPGHSGGDENVVAQTFVKRRGAGEGDPYPESWGEADVSRSINAADAHRQDGGPAVVLDVYNQSEVKGDVSHTVYRNPQPVVLDAASPATAIGFRSSGIAEGDACSLDLPPDGFRYAACGDGVAAPCAHWIGLRLLAAMRGEDPDG
jgi:hypothetical protein